MAGSLKGPLAKLERAERQFGVLQREIRKVWPHAKSWPVTPKPDKSGLKCDFYLGQIPAVDPSWALATGEILFDLRSALDHLAYELHVRRWRDNIPQEVRLPNFRRPIQVEGATQFPIYDSEGAWSSHFYRIATLSQRDRRALRLLQPYKRRNDEWHLVRSDLSALNSLHNIDKHRQLHVVVTSQQSTFMYDYAPEFGFTQTPRWGRVKPHAKVETWTFDQLPPQIQPHKGAFLDVCIEQSGVDWQLLVVLEMFMNSTAAVLRRFANRFAAVAPPEGSRYGGDWWRTERRRTWKYI